jgi:hypothetical protein
MGATEHTCILTQTTVDGSVPPPCKACQEAHDATAAEKEARELVAAATPGPWEWERRGPTLRTFSLMVPNGVDEWSFTRHPMNLLNTDAGEWDWNGEHNRAWIAWTREGVPALLATIDELRAERYLLRVGVAGASGFGEEDTSSPITAALDALRRMQKERDAAIAERDRLRAALTVIGRERCGWHYSRNDGQLCGRCHVCLANAALAEETGKT